MTRLLTALVVLAAALWWAADGAGWLSITLWAAVATKGLLALLVAAGCVEWPTPKRLSPSAGAARHGAAPVSSSRIGPTPTT